MDRLLFKALAATEAKREERKVAGKARIAAMHRLVGAINLVARMHNEAAAHVQRVKRKAAAAAKAGVHRCNRAPTRLV